MVMNVWVGTSGYSYQDWVGPFYPAGTSSNRMLSYYSGQFPVVELNFSFYRLPTAAMLGRLATLTPERFQFVVKLPRSLSHEEDQRELAPFREAVEELQRHDRLAGLLCQLPQATHHERKHLAWLDLLGRELAGKHLAVEFRHRSWHRPDVPPWLKERDLDLVSVDAPDIPALYPRGLVQSGSRLYVRFHSRNADNWYRSDKERYDYLYSDQQLREWTNALAGAIGTASEAFVFLNNCHGAQAAANARRLRELLLQEPGLQVVEPFARIEAGPRQQSLFD
jgi:uncharacterized protein YecE (DUF72 family)